MSNYIEITLWCQEDKLRALSAALEPSGSGVVKELEAALEDLYERTLPAPQRAAIAEKLDQEER